MSRPLFNTEAALLINALNFVHEAQNLEPRRIEAKEVKHDPEMAICGECAELAPRKSLVPDGRGFHFCVKCAEAHGLNRVEEETADGQWVHSHEAGAWVCE